MGIKGRIRSFQILLVAGVSAVAILVLIDLSVSRYHLERAQWAREQLAAISSLTISTSRFFEQFERVLLIGAPAQARLADARNEVIGAFVRLQQATAREAAVLRTAAERAEEGIELQRIESMQALFRQIDRAAERILVLLEQGRWTEAVAEFRAQSESEAARGFERLMSEALTDEQEEARQIEADLVRLRGLLTLSILLASGALLVITLIAGVLLARSILHPIQALTEGTLAIQEGKLDHRIQTRGRDELALLSERFNAMAKRLEEQQTMLMAAQLDLERQVAARTEELADANRRLMEIDRQRVQFLADVSHELRTPLTALRGEAEVALRGARKPEGTYRQALAKMVALSADLGKLVEDLLFLARSEAGEVRFESQLVDLGQLLDEIRQDVSPDGTRPIRIDAPVNIPPLQILGDRRRLRQALLIVLDNAMKYAAPDTSVRIGVERDGSMAGVSVQNHGPGVSQEELDQVFVRFYRGAAARDLWPGGTGLGLPIARWITEKHGGRIRITSRPEEGTIVILSFPLAG